MPALCYTIIPMQNESTVSRKISIEAERLTVFNQIVCRLGKRDFDYQCFAS